MLIQLARELIYVSVKSCFIVIEMSLGDSQENVPGPHHRIVLCIYIILKQILVVGEHTLGNEYCIQYSYCSIFKHLHHTLASS